MNIRSKLRRLRACLRLLLELDDIADELLVVIADLESARAQIKLLDARIAHMRRSQQIYNAVIAQQPDIVGEFVLSSKGLYTFIVRPGEDC